VYAFAIPTAAPHPALAERFARFLLSPDGRAILRAAGLDALDVPNPQGLVAPWMPLP
jgi:ABC-type molybdate transport system substrate-binding protein